MSTALVWFRRDLRLADHPALVAGLERHDHVVPVYIHAPDEEAPWLPGGASRWWLHHSLTTLQEALARAGSPLVVRTGPSLTALRRLVRETGAEAVYWNRLYESFVSARDGDVKAGLREDGLSVHSFNGALLVEPWELKTGGGDPYRVFTPFWRNGLQRVQEAIANGRAPLAAPNALPAPPVAPASLDLDALGLLPKIRWDTGFSDPWKPGEAGAHDRVDAFCDGSLARYRAARDVPSDEGTSRLSPHLHFGEISPLQLVARMERMKAEGAAIAGNAEWFVRELGWREFGHHLLYHFPKTPDFPMYERFQALGWRRRHEYAADLAAWERGRTGIPIIDAGMRQLWTTGWMHNRVRMLVASLLTKNLLIPWQDGARWFWDTLVDADLANNTMGWQWTAGCGADASPFFRIFNPVIQGKKFDPDGDYVRTYVPELAKLPADDIHAPWLANAGVLERAKVRLGNTYPEPIVDLATSRQRALDAYEPVRKAAKGGGDP